MVEDPLAVDLIQKCLSPRDKRPTTTELFKHPFFETPSNGETISTSSGPELAPGGDVSSSTSTISNQSNPIDAEEKTNGSQIFTNDSLLDVIDNTRSQSINPTIRLEAPGNEQNSRKDESNTKFPIGQIVHHQRKPSNLGIPHHQRKKSSEIASSSATIKCFSEADKRCIRIYFKDFMTIEQLKEIICMDLDYDIDHAVLRYTDHESDKLLITKRTTKNELLEYAKTIHISKR